MIHPFGRASDEIWDFRGVPKQYYLIFGIILWTTVRECPCSVIVEKSGPKPNKIILFSRLVAGCRIKQTKFKTLLRVLLKRWREWERGWGDLRLGTVRPPPSPVRFASGRKYGSLSRIHPVTPLPVTPPVAPTTPDPVSTFTSGLHSTMPLPPLTVRLRSRQRRSTDTSQ